jgi:predicted ATPase/DNA-binding SARP family transcriptional activator
VNVEFLILGPVEVRVEGQPVALGGAKQRAVLAALLLEPNEVVATDVLIDRVWGEEAPERAANTLQVYVSQLRKLLPEGVLVTQAPGYRLSVGAEQLDSARFHELAARGRAALAAGRAAEAAAALRQALGLWRGGPLADVAYEGFAQNEIRRLEELRVAVLEDTIDAELAAGHHAELVPELERLAAEHPLRERLRGQLMLALYRSGRQAEALEEYQRARHALVEELGIDPSPELQRLEKAILTHDESLAAPTAEPAEATRRTELPTPPTPLIGRARELGEATELLERVRLLTLTGPGGIGKTRLSLEIARRFAERDGDGAVFVGLATVNDPRLVAPTIAQALGVSEAGAEVEDALEAALRRRAPLLVLDNLEQVLAAAELLARLLAAVPELRLLVTSRAVLRLQGEHEFPVQPLEPDEAVELFVQRAQAVNRDFAPDNAERAQVAELCTGLDGIPLAIELAAARAKLLTPAALLERLGSKLELLAAGPRDLPARQQTLRATIDWSYELLDDRERGLFARLAVFVGGCTLEAAEAVGGGGGVLENLASLVDKSLIRLRSVGSESRFWLLRTMREYALEKLGASGEEAEMRRRHLAHYLALAEAADPHLNGPGLEEWSDRLELEHGNLRAAIGFALGSGEAQTALRIAGALRRFWEFHGHLAEGLRTTLGALEAAPDAPAEIRAKAWTGAGVLSGEQGDFESAQRFFEAALAEARRAGLDQRVASTLTNLGNLALYRGDYADAQRLYEESIATAERIGYLHAGSIARENRGLVMLATGDYDEAARMLEESVAEAREAGSTHDLSTRLGSLARALIARGETQRPAELLAESLEHARRLREPRNLADCLEAVAGLAAATGEAGDAAALLGAAEAQRESIGGLRPPDQQPWFDRQIATAEDALGADAFEEQRLRGRDLSLEAAVELAQQCCAVGVPPGPAS